MRFAACLFVILIALLALAASNAERKATNYGLPLVASAYPLNAQGAVTNPRGEARISLRVAPCITVGPAPPQMEDDA